MKAECQLLEAEPRPFGSGPHCCLGANLARQEMGCMIDALLDILPRGSVVVPEAMEFQNAGANRLAATLTADS